ncbi:MAG TPA: sugar kinase, partial [Longilinea sp.]|nr:sugar kinase [Longilinea sp.]
MKHFVTFGEIMLRLSPQGMLRFGQARSFDATYGGGEANVAVSLANYGLPTEFVTRLPENDIGEAALQYLRQYNVGTHYILRGGKRVGIYFMENGAVMRGSQVIYDRADSSFASLKPGMVDWKTVFAEAQWFHWTGITPAISEGAADICLEGAKMARELGVKVSCDLNFRAKLWKWGKTAGEVMG